MQIFHEPISWRPPAQRRVQLIACVFACAFLTNGGRAQDFVPFVIPARPNLDSPIAAEPGPAITADSQRLVAHSGHFYRAGERVRLWGVNLSFGANLPRHEDAPLIAARLAAAGVNAVRCHHLDTAQWPRGLWNAQDGRTISPEAMDRLDFFIDQLARRGICVDLNLHVGRAHSRYLGLPETNRQYDKISNIFTPALIEAQKQYARELLARENPYREVRYADDPAVAIVEITNENSFFMWSGEETLRTLAPYYADVLRREFNAWLGQRYGSDENLRKAWAQGAEPLGTNVLTNGDFRAASPGTSVPQGWNLEQHSGCKASVLVRPYKLPAVARIEIDKADETQWHLQLTQGGFSLKAGRYYTVSFEAAADKPREASCNVSQAHNPWANLGLSRTVDLTQDWKDFCFGFVAKDDDDNARVSFAVGGSDISVYLANVEFRPGGRLGLVEGESIDAGTVALFAENETAERTLDRMRFLAETEKGYFDEMRHFIRNDLGCAALVTGTIVFGPLGLYTQSDMDFIDSHAYWQHPRFPGKPWDVGNWLVSQKPMTDFPSEATVFRLAAERLEGKPFTLSEYNHPAPLDSQAECVPVIASFAAAQDWDGVWLYTYSHGADDWHRENMSSYFDIDTNPAKWGFMRVGSAIFRDAGISPLNGAAYVPLADPPDVLSSLASLHLKHSGNMFAAIAERGGMTREKMLQAQCVVTLGEPRGVLSLGGSNAQADWSVENGKGFYSVLGSRACVYSGHAERFEKATKGELSITAPELATVTVTALDGTALEASRRILVTACGRCENTGMVFSQDRQTVGRNWGGPPVQIETVTGTVTLPEGRWTREPLGPDGMPGRGALIGDSVLRLSPDYRTMWYLLTR